MLYITGTDANITRSEAKNARARMFIGLLLISLAGGLFGSWLIASVIRSPVIGKWGTSVNNPIAVIRSGLWMRLWMLSDRYYLQRNFDAATWAYIAAMAIDSRDPMLCNNFAWTLMRSGRHLDLALYYARRAVDAAPNDAYSLDTLGWCLFYTGRYHEAIQALRKALQIFPKQGHSWYMLGRVYEKLGRYEDAMRCYQRAITATFDGEDEFREDASARLYRLRIKRREFKWAEKEGKRK